jgi:hypothetical protein
MRASTHGGGELASLPRVTASPRLAIVFLLAAGGVWHHRRGEDLPRDPRKGRCAGKCLQTHLGLGRCIRMCIHAHAHVPCKLVWVMCMQACMLREVWRRAKFSFQAGSPSTNVSLESLCQVSDKERRAELDNLFKDVAQVRRQL